MARETHAELMSWYPAWTRQLAEAHTSGASQTFILHGNVNDLIRIERSEGVTYEMLPVDLLQARRGGRHRGRLCGRYLAGQNRGF